MVDEFNLDRVVTALSDQEEQVFPGKLDLLNRANDSIRNVYRHALGAIGTRVLGYEGGNQPKTADGYLWFFALNFRTKYGRVSVLFPYAMPSNPSQGEHLDRPIGVYKWGDVTPEETDSILTQIIDGLDKLKSKED